MQDLPLTHYDQIKKIRPELWNFLNKEILRLKEIKWSEPIHSVDDINSPFYEECIENLFIASVNHNAKIVELPTPIFYESFIESGAAQKLLLTLNHDYHNILNFELFGKKTFYFSEGLIENLLSTELNVPSELIRPPFDSCLFVMQGKAAIDAMSIGFPKWKPTAEDYKFPISITLTYFNNPNRYQHPKVLISVTHWHGSVLNMMIKREVLIRPDWDIEKSLRTDWEAIEENSKDNETNSNIYSSSSLFYNDALSFFRLILNSILYITSNNPDITQVLSKRNTAIKSSEKIRSQVKSKKAKQQAKKLSELDYHLVGKDVGQIIINKDIKSSDTTQKNNNIEYAVRFLVRGHWRNQACGSELTDRRLVWIKPYYKGPEMADLINRPYIAK